MSRKKMIAKQAASEVISFAEHPHSELRFFLAPDGAFFVLGLYQSYSANPAFLRGSFQNCVRNLAEPFAAEISVAVIGIKVADRQHNPFGIFMPVCKAEADHIGYHLKGYFFQVSLIKTLGDIIRQGIFFLPKRSGFKSIGENIIKAKRPCAFCIERKDRHLVFPHHQMCIGRTPSFSAAVSPSKCSSDTNYKGTILV